MGASAHVHAVTGIASGGTPSYSAAYDAAGDMTCRALASSSCDNPTPSGQALTYDALRRLVSWQGTTPGDSEQYADDGEGTRVWRQTTSGGTTTTTVSVLGVEDVTAVSGGATTTTRYYALPGGVTATRDSSGLVYEASDQLGTPIAALNLSTGIVGEQLYAPYGQARYAANGTGSGGGMRTPFGFTGQREDTAPSGASGLDYFNARYYDAATGRFTSADDAQPGLGDPSGQDNYAYVGGMVESATDPSGHDEEPGDARIQGGIATATDDGTQGVVDAADRYVRSLPVGSNAPTTTPPTTPPPPPPPIDSPVQAYLGIRSPTFNNEAGTDNTAGLGPDSALNQHTYAALLQTATDVPINRATDPLPVQTTTPGPPPPPQGPGSGPTPTPVTVSATESDPPEAAPQPATGGSMQGGGVCCSCSCTPGPYKRVGGHHIFSKRAFTGYPGPTYEDILANALAISQADMAQNGWKHGAMTTTQQQLFRQLAADIALGLARNTLSEHSRIAYEALVAGNVPPTVAEDLVFGAYFDLIGRGVDHPTYIPWVGPNVGTNC